VAGTPPRSRPRSFASRPTLCLDPRNVAGINRAMDATLLGHPYAKSPIDIACWDLLGKAAGLSVTALLGGRLSERFPLYFAVPVGDRDEMVAYVAARKAEGIRRFQLKVGGDPAEDVRRIEGVLETLVAGDVAVADANGGWSFQDAVLAVRLLRDVPDLYLEQPCRSMADCVAIRKLTDLPMIYDECVVDVESLYVAVRQGGAGGINLKLSRVGGLSAARIVRDVAVSLGTMLTIEDSWGGDVATAAVSHLAASTPPELLFTTSFFNDWTNEHVAGHRPRSVEGFGASPDGAGLGIEVDVERLGEPLFSVR